jgi:hypothetical protein
MKQNSRALASAQEEKLGEPADQLLHRKRKDFGQFSLQNWVGRQIYAETNTKNL